MKKLSELYEGYPDILINDIKINSKEVKKGDLFVCIKGVNVDRHDYIMDAINNGAVCIVASKKVELDIPVIYVEDTNKELALLASKFYDYPEKELELIAVTGTNGKTTVASIIQDLMGNNICGYMGTNGIICHEFNEKIKNTTPDADRLYKYFRKFVDSGCKYLSMETSSEAFLRGRCDSLKIKIGIVTNITEDHLNIHKTIENYVSCKKKIVDLMKNDGILILNSDDKYFNEFKSMANCKVLTYGKQESDLQIVNIVLDSDKTIIDLKYQNKIYNITSPLLGEFNVYNLCASILTLLSLDYQIEDIIKNIKNIHIPKGRMEQVDFGQKYQIIIDYAHTYDAFQKIYKLLDTIKKGRIITVTGSAGGREHEKRPLMGKIVLDKSDYVIFTMDDPRGENVDSIIDDLISQSNKNNYERIINREEAIIKALEIAKENDIVLIAGKGDDNYMAIGDNYLPYKDYDVVKKYFDNKKLQ